MIIGTAGHIDHGKSALVTALTGAAMDRLAEEQRRGITIDLNIAPFDLDGTVAGVVDVPGHEDFVRTMVAGASGIDLALLVIAADEGIMPQTEEHLAILEQLGVRTVLPVVTKSDLVEPDWLDLVLAEVAERGRRSDAAFEPPLAVSVVTGQGLDTLRQRLRDHATRTVNRPADDVFRLPVDRAFSVAGVGTVITGTAWSGSVGVGDRVRLLPGSGEGRVRSIETHGKPLDRSQPGARVALGIAGLERTDARRGQVVVAAGVPWAVSETLDVSIRMLPGRPPLAPRARVRLHLGTAEVMARVAPRAADGAARLARLRLERPLVARGGDRFVLRSYSPVTTVGGGTVLDPDPPRRAGLWPTGLADADPRARVAALVARRPFGAAAAALPLLSGLPPPAADQAAGAVQDLQRVGHLWVRRAVVGEARDRALAALARYHRQAPAELGMPLETLRRAFGVPEILAAAALEALIEEGGIEVRQAQARLPGFAPQVAGGDAEMERIVAIVRKAGLAPPSVGELEKETGRRDIIAVLRLAAARGDIEAVERDRYYDAQALHRFTAAVREVGRGGDIQPAALRDRLGISRKFLIPLLEWADARGITVRSGERRRLASARE
ncbi:MAG TPA: selenocysteine-specific translation elongation factor [Gemmatimonadales bacterium]|nr:selenocysteine-specific translation elongation factor [Gemmatimonadales bacterium]